MLLPRLRLNSSEPNRRGYIAPIRQAPHSAPVVARISGYGCVSLSVRLRIMVAALEFAANCPSVGKMTPTREFSGGCRYSPIHLPESLHISRFGPFHGQTRRFAVAAFLKGWVFGTHSHRFNPRGQIVSFSPFPLNTENERAKRCDY